MRTISRLQLRQLGAIAGAWSLLVLAGCAGVSSGGPQPTDPGVGLLSVVPATLSFGSVAIGAHANLTGTLTAGSSDVNVTSAGWAGEGYSVSGITFPVTVAAGKSINYTVTFSPTASGDSNGNVSFVYDGSNAPLVQGLDGNGGQAGLHTVGLSWKPSTSSVVGYNVYRGTQPGGPYELMTTSPQPDNTYADSTVLTGTTYYYVATSVDSNHVESTYSNQAEAIVPQ